MEIEYFGGNCVKLSNKKANLIVDDNLAELGLKTKITSNDISLVTSKDIKVDNDARFSINCPGSYEISDISVKGIAARSHLDEDGERATVYVVRIGDFSVAIVGHIYPDVSDQLAEDIGVVDILIIPVGGSGYTLDAVGAAKVANKIDPKVVIPTHYADSKINYPVPQSELAEFLKVMGSNEPEKTSLLKVKESELGDKMHVVVVERS
ncbi:MBL fold metallo-hydrolase [Candidatus Saccharibacteria bacterium]|nr:MBL fold metallo-hydrolase [Candidatus Saccharibacteria bacterium]